MPCTTRYTPVVSTPTFEVCIPFTQPCGCQSLPFNHTRSGKRCFCHAIRFSPLLFSVHSLDMYTKWGNREEMFCLTDYHFWMREHKQEFIPLMSIYQSQFSCMWMHIHSEKHSAANNEGSFVHPLHSDRKHGSRKLWFYMLMSFTWANETHYS